MAFALGLATAVILCFLLVILIRSRAWYRRYRRVGYRQRYLDLVRQVERLVLRFNQLGALLPVVSDKKLLSVYEKNLQSLTQLLSMFVEIQPHSGDVATLNSALFLMKDCSERSARLKLAFKKSAAGDNVDYARLGTGHKGFVQGGCYFCSRPFIYSKFARVRVKLDGSMRHVYGCSSCREELSARKRVKVLYFMKNGKPVHWSEMGTYNPMHDYWHVTKRNGLSNSGRLELVYSRNKRDC